MANVKRVERPLSPHLQIYRVQVTSVTSILTRITGNALIVGVALAVWWLLAAATSAEANNTAGSSRSLPDCDTAGRCGRANGRIKGMVGRSGGKTYANRDAGAAQALERAFFLAPFCESREFE